MTNTSNSPALQLPIADAHHVANVAATIGPARAYELATKLAVSTDDEQLTKTTTSRLFTFNDHSTALFSITPNADPHLFSISINVDFDSDSKPYLPLLDTMVSLSDDGETFTVHRSPDSTSH